MSSYHFVNSETDTEVIIDDNQAFTFIEPGFDIHTDKVSPEVAEKWAETKAAIEDFVGLLRDRGPGLEPVIP
jgi:hypothetical protein